MVAAREIAPASSILHLPGIRNPQLRYPWRADGA